MKCCRHCKTNNTYAVCTNYFCWCHALQESTKSYSPITYADPTGSRAVNNVSRKQSRRKRRQK